MAKPLTSLDAVELDAVIGAGSFWEHASTWDPRKGRYVSTDDFKRDRGLDSVCQRASCWDSKSGRYIGADAWNDRNSKSAD